MTLAVAEALNPNKTINHLTSINRHNDIVSPYMHIFGVQNPKVCIETQFKFLWVWPSKTSLWDSMMLIHAAREILYTGPLSYKCYHEPLLTMNLGYHCLPG